MNRLSLLESDLKNIVGNDYVFSSPVDLALYECDAETLDVARPDLVVLPANTNEICQVVQVANKYNVPFTPRGAGTGLSGGATPIMGGISLVLTRLTRVFSIDPEEMIAHVEVGVTNKAVSLLAEQFGLCFAPDPSSQSASTIGGNIAENAGGAHTLKYGMTASHVLGVKLVLPSGIVTTYGGSYIDSLNLDVLGVIIGSEGTLGIVSEAYLRLIPKAQNHKTMLAYFSTLESGGQTVSDIIACGIVPAAMEMMDKLSCTCVEQALHLGLNIEAGALLIIELDGHENKIEHECLAVESLARKNQALSIKWAGTEAERNVIWKARKSAFAALGRIAPNGYVLDGVIPRSRLKEAISKIDNISKKYGLPISNIYHAGDGNLHPALLYNRDNTEEAKQVMLAAREILELCVHLGGTLSGEHGIGIEKKHEMPLVFSPPDLETMLKVKECFNPHDLCNPGKIIPAPKTCGESGMRPLLRYQLASC